MTTCRGGMLKNEDLRFFARYRGFCDVISNSWDVLVPKIDAITEFARTQEETFETAVNYATVTIVNNAHRTTLIRDLVVFSERNSMSEEMLLGDASGIIARVCVLSDGDCSDEKQEIVERCQG